MRKREYNSNLDFAIALVQLGKHVDEIDRAIKKDIKKGLRKFFTFIIPFGITVAIVIANPSTLTGATCFIVSLGALGINIVGDIKEQLSLSDKKHQSSFFSPTFKEILAKGIDPHKHQEFYKDKFIEFLEKDESRKTEDQIKYERALEKQKRSSVTEDFISEDEIFDREETMKRITSDFEMYRTLYKIPPINISSHDWEVFFDELYVFLFQKTIENRYYEMCSFLLEITLATVLVNKNRTLTIFDFIANLGKLKSDGTNTGVKISLRECLELQKSMLTKMDKKKIIELNPKKDES